MSFTESPAAPAGLGETVVVGGCGMLGQDLVAALSKDPRFGPPVVADIEQLNISDPGSVERFFAGRHPRLIFNCAACTDVDGCETNRSLAFSVNADGAGHLARAAEEAGARFIHVSTDFVFNGRKKELYTEEDVPYPLSVYGLSKLEGERRVMKRCRNAVIARTAWLYGRGRTNFVERILAVARGKGEIMGATDQQGSPTWTRDLAAALVALALADVRGIFHVCNSGVCSRCEQIRFIIETAGLRTVVQPVSSRDFPRPARVPAWSALSTGKLQRETGHVMRPWQEAMAEFIRTESVARG